MKNILVPSTSDVLYGLIDGSIVSSTWNTLTGKTDQLFSYAGAVFCIFRAAEKGPKNLAAAPATISWSRWRAACGGWTGPIYYLESEGHRVHYYTEDGDFLGTGHPQGMWRKS